LDRAIVMPTQLDQARIAELGNALAEQGTSPDDFATDGFEAVCIHVDSVIVAANPAFCALTGYGPDEVLGLNAWILFPPGSLSVIMEKLKKRDEGPYDVLAIDSNGDGMTVRLRPHNLEVAGQPARAVAVKRLG
jgi:PAS domain S-box-containing protein